MSNKHKSIIEKSAHEFSERYSENPTAAILITAISVAVPQVAIGKEAIERAVTKIQKERFETLLDELATSQKLLTPDIIESEEFIHSFVVVHRAAMNTYQREKIRRFARILIHAIEEDELASNKFEEFVRILESVSERELRILSILQSFEDTNPHQVIDQDQFDEKATISGEEHIEDDFQRCSRFWSDFQQHISDTLDIQASLLIPILKGLNRTGLYETIIGVILEYSGNRGQTTHLYKQFAAWIKLEAETDSILYPEEPDS